MADETRWGHTHDRAQHVAHAQRAAKHVRILLKAPDLQLMADHEVEGAVRDFIRRGLNLVALC
jgi:hypothetical protein